ncbi:hypothetical protein ACLI4U_19030 (plasmid) [Natrialbaceae archaeon A-CW2]
MSRLQAFNPFNWPDHLRQRKERDPENGDSARDVQDPHVWEDPDPSWRERLLPDTVGQWLSLLSGLLIAAGLILYLYPVFGRAFRNPLTIAATVIMAALIVSYLIGRQHGIRAYVDMVKSIIYYGDDIDVRLGEEQGEQGNRTLFTPYVDLSYGGFSARKLKKRDLPYDASKIRSNTADDAGEEPVIDRLNATTVSAETETLGSVYFTHAEDLKHDAFGQYSDRYTSLPTELDEDVVENVHELIDSLEHTVRHRARKIEMLEESNEDLRTLKETQTSPQLEETLQLLMMLRQAMPSNRRQSSGESIEFDDKYDEAYEEMKNA